MTKTEQNSPYDTLTDDEILSMEEDDFLDSLHALFHENDTTGLILLQERLVYIGVSSWKQTDNLSAEHIVDTRDTRLVPAIQRLGLVCLDSIRFNDLSIYNEGLNRLATIYDLARFRELGTKVEGTHLSWTVPSKQSIIQLYILGGYAIFRKRMEAVRFLLDLESYDVYQSYPSFLITHPHFSTESGERGLDDHFNDALDLIQKSPTLSSLFYDEKQDIIGSLCQFDFVVNFAMWAKGQRSYPNYARLPKTNTVPIVVKLFDEEASHLLVDSFDPKIITQFIKEIDEQWINFHFKAWHSSYWPDAIRQLFSNHT